MGQLEVYNINETIVSGLMLAIFITYIAVALESSTLESLKGYKYSVNVMSYNIRKTVSKSNILFFVTRKSNKPRAFSTSKNELKTTETTKQIVRGSKKHNVTKDSKLLLALSSWRNLSSEEYDDRAMWRSLLYGCLSISWVYYFFFHHAEEVAKNKFHGTQASIWTIDMWNLFGDTFSAFTGL